LYEDFGKQGALEDYLATSSSSHQNNNKKVVGDVVPGAGR